MDKSSARFLLITHVSMDIYNIHISYLKIRGSEYTNVTRRVRTTYVPA